jgi:hypothetical protein
MTNHERLPHEKVPAVVPVDNRHLELGAVPAQKSSFELKVTGPAVFVLACAVAAALSRLWAAG